MAAATEDDAGRPPPGRSRGRQAVQGLLSLALVLAIFVFVLPRVADLSRVWAEIRAMTWMETATLVVAAAWNLATYSLVWMACLPGLGFVKAGVAAEASTAVANTVPGGSYLAIGLTYTMLHSWGFRRSIVTLALLVTGLWNTFAKLALPVIALVALAFVGGATTGRLVAGALGVVALVVAAGLLALALRSEASAARIGDGAARAASAVTRLVHRAPATGWDIAVTRFREKVIGLVRTRWHLMTGATVLSHLSLFAVLLVALRSIGVAEHEVSWAEALAVFAFTRLVTAVPVTPGGLGVVELAMSGGLVAAGGDSAQVVAAVLVYRVLTFLPPVPIGVGCYVLWRVKRSWRRDPTPSGSPSPPTGGAARVPV